MYYRKEIGKKTYVAVLQDVSLFGRRFQQDACNLVRTMCCITSHLISAGIVGFVGIRPSQSKLISNRSRSIHEIKRTVSE